MNWKFKEGLERQGSSDGFWYDITDGGYIRPDKLLADPDQSKKLEEAIDLVISFRDAMEKNDLIEEF